MKFRRLLADEIECRVNTINEKGLSLLLYKDARCDMNILDKTIGEDNWQRKQFLDNVDNQMLYLNNDFTSLKGCVTDSAAVEGGTSKSEDHIINNIMRRDKLNINKSLSIQFVLTD